MNRMKLSDFTANVIQWSRSRGIYEHLTWQSQLSLYYQETFECITAKDMDELKTEFGDRIVCLINVRKMHDGSDSLMMGMNTIGADCNIADGCHTLAICSVFAEIEACGLDPENCLYLTWEKINARRGMCFSDAEGVGKYVKVESMTDDQLNEYQIATGGA